jgi:hypothetical protein
MARTQATLDALVQALQVNCGDLFDACRRCAVSLVFVNQWKKDDKEVADVLNEAERVGALALQSVAIKRAVHGVEKGVYFKGERVDTEIQYSDGLLTTLLKGRLPDIYGADAAESRGNTFNGPTQINIMPRAENYEDWLRMKDATLERRDALDAAEGRGKALPAPPVTIDVTPEPREQSLESLANIVCRPPASSPFEGLGL